VCDVGGRRGGVTGGRNDVIDTTAARAMAAAKKTLRMRVWRWRVAMLARHSRWSSMEAANTRIVPGYFYVITICYRVNTGSARSPPLSQPELVAGSRPPASVEVINL